MVEHPTPLCSIALFKALLDVYVVPQYVTLVKFGLLANEDSSLHYLVLLYWFNQSYTQTNIKYFRKFYLFSKSHTMCDKLSWSHYRSLLYLQNNNEIKYYLMICKKNNKYVIEYCSDKRIISREYQLI